MPAPADRSDLARVLTARFISRAGGVAAFFVGVWGKAAYTLHANPAQLAALMFVLSVASILGSMIGGVLVDRHGPRRVLAYAEIAFVPAALIVPLAHTMPQFTALVALYSFLAAPVMTANSSFAPFLAGDDESQLKRINAYLDATASLAFVLGPALGALVVSVATPDWLFAVDAATSAVGAMLVLSTAQRALPPHDGERQHPVAELREGLRAAYGMRSVRFFVLGGTLVWLGFGAFGALEPLFYRDVVHTGVQTIGWMNAIFGVGLLLGAGALRYLPKRLLSATFATVVVVATGLGAILYVGSAELWRIAIGGFTWGLIIGLVEPLLRTLLHRDSPKGLVGRIMGTADTHRHAGELLPLAFAPAVAALVGVQRTLIAGGLVVAVVALAGIPEALAIDRLRPPTTEETSLEALSPSDDPKVPSR